MSDSDAAAFSPSQYAIASRILIKAIDVDEGRITLSGSSLGAGVRLNTENNTISAKPGSESALPASYLVFFEVAQSLVNEGWGFASPYAAGIIPSGNSTYFLVPASEDGTEVSIAFSDNIQKGSSSQTYKVCFGLKKNSGTPIWIDDPSIAFNPPD